MKLLKYIPFIYKEIERLEWENRELKKEKGFLKETIDDYSKREQIFLEEKLRKCVDKFNELFPVGARINYLGIEGYIIKPATLNVSLSGCPYHNKGRVEYRLDGKIQQTDIPLEAVEYAERYSIVKMEDDK